MRSGCRPTMPNNGTWISPPDRHHGFFGRRPSGCRHGQWRCTRLSPGLQIPFYPVVSLNAGDNTSRHGCAVSGDADSPDLRARYSSELQGLSSTPPALCAEWRRQGGGSSQFRSIISAMPRHGVDATPILSFGRSRLGLQTRSDGVPDAVMVELAASDTQASGVALTLFYVGASIWHQCGAMPRLKASAPREGMCAGIDARTVPLTPSRSIRGWAGRSGGCARQCRVCRAADRCRRSVRCLSVMI